MASEEEVMAYKKGAWSREEDEKLIRAVHEYGLKNWVAIEKYSGLARPAKNCRLRWLNYLRPNLKKHPLTPEEEDLILYLHSKYGNSWSRIASELPGRSDNDIKNFWHKRTKKCQKYQLPIYSLKSEDGEPKPGQGYPPNCENTLTSDPNVSMSSPENQFSHTTSFPNTPNSQARNSPHQTPQSCPINTRPLHQDNSGFNMFVSFRKPPILSTPNGSFKRFSRDAGQSLQRGNSADSSNTMKCSGPSMESPRSPFKLELSPGVPSQYSVQMDSKLGLDHRASYMNRGSLYSSSGSQLISPNTGSCSPSSLLTYGDSAVQLDQTEPMSFDLNPAVTAKTELPLAQSEAKVMLETNEFTHGAECDNSLELMNELKEAQARVKFLKKKLRFQRRIPNNRSLLRKGSLQEFYSNSKSSLVPDLTDAFLNQNLSQIASKECFPDMDAKKERSLLGESMKVNDGHTCISRRKESVVGIAKKGLRTVKSVNKGKRLCKLGRRGSSEGEQYEEEEEEEEEAEEKEKFTEDAGKTTTKEKRHGDDDLMSEILKAEDSMLSEKKTSFTSQETLNAVNPRSSEDEFCSVTEGLNGELSNLMAELLNQRFDMEQLFASQGQELPIDVDVCPIYSQSSGEQLSYFQHGEVGLVNDSFRQEFSDEKPATGLIDSCFLSGNQDTSNGSQVGENFSFQNGNLPETSSAYELMSLLHQYTTRDLLDPDYLVHTPAFENNSPHRYYTLTCNGDHNVSNLKKIECTSSSYTLEQKPHKEENMIEGLLIENLWQEEHAGSPDHILLTDRADHHVLDSSIVQSMDSKHGANESGGSYEAGVMRPDLDHNDQETMPEDLLSQLKFFHTTIQTQEWYNQSLDDTDEFNHLGVSMLSPSPPAITTSDYI